jgi:hypothetical protein
VVAERLGFDREEALTLGKAVAGMNAASKGIRLGILRPATPEAKKERAERRKGELVQVELLGRRVPATRTPAGLRAFEGDRPSDPASVERYLAGKFGDSLADATEAMRTLARSYPPKALAERAFPLYEAFRPEVPRGARGWGARGTLDLDRIRGLRLDGR